MDKKYFDFDTIRSKIEHLWCDEWYDEWYYEHSYDDDYFNRGYDKAISDVLEILAEMPTADVQEVRHGYWKERMSTPSSLKCSNCGNSHEYNTTYCPWCGARMDGDEGGKS